ncbi:hypothetical protein L3X38_032230 [Prunus dulcis]|uniref:Uncharacterized protein n=1 Tax=Prunus dulcis TaxID=3755 RepID=A0AAD4VEQ9_PRUDU|nr:hypothetical protein L3X38_032230 [Prunus dulcis]
MTLSQVNYASFKETVDQDDNPPDIEEFIDIVQPAPPQMKEEGQAKIDDLQEINLGTTDKPRRKCKYETGRTGSSR